MKMWIFRTIFVVIIINNVCINVNLNDFNEIINHGVFLYC